MRRSYYRCKSPKLLDAQLDALTVIVNEHDLSLWRTCGVAIDHDLWTDVVLNSVSSHRSVLSLETLHGK